MKKVELVCFGNLKFKGLSELEAMYIKKIQYFTTFTVCRLDDLKIQDEKVLLAKQAAMIKKKLIKGDWVVSLDKGGDRMDSTAFARFLGKKISYHPGRLIFIIGGHAGLSPCLNEHIGTKISFSDMTMAHDIFRIVFLEQLFRAFSILKGMKYHR